jgi:outer membrane protein OmpU
MKKIIAAAVAAAFVAPAFAADVSVSGGADWYYKDGNNNTESGLDSDAFTIGASTETANGIGVSIDMNLTSQGATDGGSSITLSGDFGKLDLGDTSSATDAFDDLTDKDVVVGGVGTSGVDAGMSWTLPTIAPGLTLVVTHSADDVQDANGVTNSATGYGFKYSTGMVSIAAATNDAQTDANDQTYVGATVSFSGLNLAIEQMSTGASGAEETEKGVGLTYSMGDTSFAVSNVETEDAAGAITADNTVVTVTHSLGGGVTAFAETRSNSKDASADATAVGVTFKF